MRKIITISLPEKMLQQISCEIASKNFATRSEFFRRIYQNWLKDQENRRYLLNKQSKKLLRRTRKNAKVDLR